MKETAFSGVFATVDALKAKGAEVLVHDPMYTDAELAGYGFTPYNFGQTADAAIVQANHAAYADIVSADLPGVRTVVDGRKMLKPGQLSQADVVVLGVAG